MRMRSSHVPVKAGDCVKCHAGHASERALLLRVSMDEYLRSDFWGDWKILEDIEEDERAEVPPRWHEERARAVQRERTRGAEHWREHTLPGARNFFPDYEPDWEALWASRHRRRYPVPDEPVARRITAHKKYVGVE